MRKTGFILLASLLVMITSCASLTKEEGKMTKQLQSIHDLDKLDTPTHDVSMYPEAKNGYKRVLINLPSLKNENDFEVELKVGKWQEVDCNHHSLMGAFEEQTVQGWGYNYYDFESDGRMISTRMGCPDQELENKLINAQSKKVRYNSKLPIVVYIPEGYVVSYSIWTNIGGKTLK